MIITLALLGGVISSLIVIGLARMKNPQGERRIYAAGLLGAALVYLLLALAGGASARWLGVESLGVIIYGAVAWAGLRGWPGLLALGWAAHVAWDTLLHLNGAGAEYTPGWYPWLCISFDLVIAAAIVVSFRRGGANSSDAA